MLEKLQDRFKGLKRVEGPSSSTMSGSVTDPNYKHSLTLVFKNEEARLDFLSHADNGPFLQGAEISMPTFIGSGKKLVITFSDYPAEFSAKLTELAKDANYLLQQTATGPNIKALYKDPNPVPDKQTLMKMVATKLGCGLQAVKKAHDDTLKQAKQQSPGSTSLTKAHWGVLYANLEKEARERTSGKAEEKKYPSFQEIWEGAFRVSNLSVRL